MIYVDTRAGRFAAWSAGDGPLVLCLHGFPDTAATFEPLVPHLGGYRVVAPWMRGYAPSMTTGPCDEEQLADDVLALADALSPDRPAFVVGHDWGAVAAYGAIARAPARFAAAATLAVPHPAAFLRNLPRRPAQIARSWYMTFFQLPRVPEWAIRHGLIERLWRAWSPALRRPLDDVVRCVTDSLPGPLEYYRTMGRRLAAGRRPQRTRISVPTLFLHGSADGCIGADMAEGQERFFVGELRQDVLEGRGHFLHLEDPAGVGARIVSWLGRHAPPAGR
ncbi:MAG TPA: alpha/beta fold hydrolase [Haliangiales bacterium]|nr:alpha/beta fold hydrolase [Haliangiales bacterium]